MGLHLFVLGHIIVTGSGYRRAENTEGVTSLSLRWGSQRQNLRVAKQPDTLRSPLAVMARHPAEDLSTIHPATVRELSSPPLCNIQFLPVS